MNIQGLYRLDRKDLGRLCGLLSESFMEDPLFQQLIPDEGIRKKLLPLYFECYLDTFFDYCHAFADSERLDGVVLFFDDTDPFSKLRYLCDGLRCGFVTAMRVVKSDPTLHTALRFLRGTRYLKSSWVKRAVHAPSVHIDFLAVRESARGKGLATKLVSPILHGAADRALPTTLETHNPRNVALYSHFGFKTVLEIDGPSLCQYCMVK